MTMLAALLTKLKDALEPEVCGYCQAPNPGPLSLCEACQGQLGMRSSIPLTQTREGSLYSATLFTPPVKRVLYQYKFNHQLGQARILTNLLVDYWSQLSPTITLPKDLWVVPIPMRLGGDNNRMRRFVKPFAEKVGANFEDSLLFWSRDTQPQHTLHQKQRRFQNLENSMIVKTPTLKSPLSGSKMVLIVDDLTTTGATLREAMAAFRRCPWFEGDVMGLAVSHVPLAFHR